MIGDFTALSYYPDIFAEKKKNIFYLFFIQMTLASNGGGGVLIYHQIATIIGRYVVF